jgi:hypothetical protein
VVGLTKFPKRKAFALSTYNPSDARSLTQVKRINDFEFIFNHLIMLPVLRIKEWETISNAVAISKLSQ